MIASARSPSTASTTAGFDAAVRRPRPPPRTLFAASALLVPPDPGGAGGGLGPKPGGLGRGQARGGPVPRQSGPLAGPRPAPAALSTQPKGRRRLPLPPASRWARGEGAAAGRGEEREHRATCDRGRAGLGGVGWRIRADGRLGSRAPFARTRGRSVWFQEAQAPRRGDAAAVRAPPSFLREVCTQACEVCIGRTQDACFAANERSRGGLVGRRGWWWGAGADPLSGPEQYSQLQNKRTGAAARSELVRKGRTVRRHWAPYCRPQALAGAGRGGTAITASTSSLHRRVARLRPRRARIVELGASRGPARDR